MMYPLLVSKLPYDLPESSAEKHTYRSCMYFYLYYNKTQPPLTSLLCIFHYCAAITHVTNVKMLCLNINNGF